MNVDELISGGAPAAKFPVKGASIRGKILAWDDQQQTDLDTGKPIVYEDSGKPAMQYVITLQTDLRDPEIEDDDGKRRVFAKGQMRLAVREAVKQSGQKTGTTIGGDLAVRWSDEKPSTKRGFNPQKIYEAKYEPPVTGGPFDEDDWAR